MWNPVVCHYKTFNQFFFKTKLATCSLPKVKMQIYFQVLNAFSVLQPLALVHNRYL